MGAQGKVKERLHKMKLFALLPTENCFQERLFALQKAIAWVESSNQRVIETQKASQDSPLS